MQMQNTLNRKQSWNSVAKFKTTLAKSAFPAPEKLFFGLIFQVRLA